MRRKHGQGLLSRLSRWEANLEFRDRDNEGTGEKEFVILMLAVERPLLAIERPLDATLNIQDLRNTQPEF